VKRSTKNKSKTKNSKSAKKYKPAANGAELSPDEAVRLCDAPRFFGIGRTAFAEARKKGLIEAPMAAYPGSRAQIYTGRQILDHHRRQAEAAAAKPGDQIAD